MSKKRILCYGDSNTWGYIAETSMRRDEDHRWTGVCQKELGNDYVIVEDGLNGRTTVFDQPTNPYKNGLKCLGYTLTAQKPLDLVVVMLGTNDYGYADTHGVADGIDEIVRTLMNADYIYRNSQPIYADGPKVLLVSPILIGAKKLADEANTGYGRNCRDNEKLAGLCREIASTRGTYFLDAAQYAKACDYDGIHFDDESHIRFGKVMADKIREILG